jgi:hypothetical protein
MSGGGFGSGPRARLHRNPGRSGSGWRKARRATIANQGWCCASCGERLDESVKAGEPNAVEVDHHPVPLFVIRRKYESEAIDLAEYNRRAQDTKNLVARHRRCHEAHGATAQPQRQPQPVQSTEWASDSLDGADTRPVHANDPARVVQLPINTDHEAQWQRLLDGYAERPEMWHMLLTRRGCKPEEADGIIARRKLSA